jgi:Fe-S cluster biosynthesis and repair protein YggX
MYQKAIGEQNLLKQFDDLANSESIQASLAEMQYEKRSGNKSTEPRSFPHYKRIAKIFDRAKKRAWAKIKKENDVQKLLIEERNQKVQNRSANQRTIDKILDINK